MTPDPLIQLIHRTDRVPVDTLTAAAEVVTVQVREHLAPAWGVGEDVAIEVVGQGEQPTPGAWWMVVTDTGEVANALGYHDTTDEGLPLGYVFAKPTLDTGRAISGVISHEVCEALVDPRINEYAFDDNGAFWAQETSDAVQGNDYQIEGVTVADFVFPSFFHKRDRTPPYDYMGVVKRPFQTMPAGYQIKYTRGRGMHQVFGTPRRFALLAPKPKPPIGSRRERRVRGRGKWRNSNPNS